MEDNQSKKTVDTIICPICGWEHNLTQLDDPDFAGGPNILSLNQTREWFRIKRQMDTGIHGKLMQKKMGIQL